MVLKRTLATIQVDLDGLWTNLSYYGHDVSISPDILFETAVPRYLELFREFGIKATFFVIGRDTADPLKRELLKRIYDEEHELANHTYSHPFGLRKCSLEQKKKEILEGEKALLMITGRKPVGFKAPGYDIDTEVLQILHGSGYRYDSSYISTFVYPIIMRLNTWFKGGVLRTHGPRWHWFLKKNKPYVVASNRRGKLLEIPCTVMPLLRIPIHATFIVKLGFFYFKIAHSLVRLLKIPLNYEFHAADLADEIHDPRLGHLIGIPLEKRLQLFRRMLQELTKHHTFVTSAEFALRLRN
ncbi:polysaccharide deacetylase family protein [Candidatus Woesearchaeota archaeon]|nr:polysaccharide deacetylase family protein [Candidatus Woesearchaeota archaeon]